MVNLAEIKLNLNYNINKKEESSWNYQKAKIKNRPIEKREKKGITRKQLEDAQRQKLAKAQHN